MGRLSGDKLTDKQRIFVKEYLVSFNATQAAIKAGYSKKSAKSVGYENLTKPHIQEEIKKQHEERRKRLGIQADDIVNRLWAIANGNIAEYADWKGRRISLKPSDMLNKTQKYIINEISDTQWGVKIKLADKIKALELLGRHLGLFAENVNHDGDNNH